MNDRRREVLGMLALSVGLGLLFRFVPELDLWAASQFFSPERGFFSPDNWWLAIPYRGVPRLAQLGGLILLVGWLGSFVIARWQPLRRQCAFLLAALIVGPHLVVGIGLKENVGRARPANIEQFGGVQHFTPAFVLSDQCHKNCAFVSAHVAAASFIMAFGWLATPPVRRRWLWAGTGFAAVLGLARMAQGGHFLSDVIFAWLAVYWSLWGVEGVFRWRNWISRKTPLPLNAESR